MQKTSKKLAHFIDEYLEPDGLFMVRMIANNASDFVATDLIKELWKRHYKNYSVKFADEPQDSDGVCFMAGHNQPSNQTRMQSNNETLEFRNRHLRKNVSSSDYLGADSNLQLQENIIPQQSIIINNQPAHQHPLQTQVSSRIAAIDDEQVPFIPLSQQIINENSMSSTRRREHPNQNFTKI
jgi:hypothetical protein